MSDHNTTQHNTYRQYQRSLQPSSSESPSCERDLLNFYSLWDEIDERYFEENFPSTQNALSGECRKRPRTRQVAEVAGSVSYGTEREREMERAKAAEERESGGGWERERGEYHSQMQTLSLSRCTLHPPTFCLISFHFLSLCLSPFPLSFLSFYLSLSPSRFLSLSLGQRQEGMSHIDRG